MNAGAIILQPVDLLIATILVVVAGGVSVWLRLGLEGRLAVAALRTVVQLLLIGFILRWVFAFENLAAVLAVAAIMVIAASRAAVRRPARSFSGAALMAFITLVCTGLITTAFVTGVVIGKQPWYAPQYLIPLLGMVLGNGLTGISLCLDHLLETLAERSNEVEMELAHGATRWEAARAPLAESVRRGMIPIINSMSVVGIVSLPGMMTGQILAGANPVEAVKYQVVVMFMIAGATSMGCISIAVLVYHRLFNQRHQLETQRIRKR